MSGSNAVTIKFVGVREVIDHYDQLPSMVRRLLVAKASALAIKLEEHVTEDKLSGQVLHIITGNLRRSIFNRVDDTDTQVTGTVGSSGDVKYAAIHEFGGKIDIPEIVPVKAKALHWVTKGGDHVFARRARAHTVNMPERSFLRSSLSDMKQEIMDGLREAVVQGLGGTL